MGTFRRGDCPHLVKGNTYWCKLKSSEIINNTNLTPKEKYARLRKITCSGCEIYKQCGKPHQNKNA